MLDDLAEFLLELGGEAAGAILEYMWEKKKCSKQSAPKKRGEPWEQAAQKPPWED